LLATQGAALLTAETPLLLAAAERAFLLHKAQDPVQPALILAAEEGKLFAEGIDNGTFTTQATANRECVFEFDRQARVGRGIGHEDGCIVSPGTVDLYRDAGDDALARGYYEHLREAEKRNLALSLERPVPLVVQRYLQAEDVIGHTAQSLSELLLTVQCNGCVHRRKGALIKSGLGRSDSKATEKKRDYEGTTDRETTTQGRFSFHTSP
jgi:hypothetical protein